MGKAAPLSMIAVSTLISLAVAALLGFAVPIVSYAGHHRRKSQHPRRPGLPLPHPARRRLGGHRRSPLLAHALHLPRLPPAAGEKGGGIQAAVPIAGTIVLPRSARLILCMHSFQKSPRMPTQVIRSPQAKRTKEIRKETDIVRKLTEP